jgi:hypothetical protein
VSPNVLKTYRFFSSGGESVAVRAVWDSSSSPSSTIGIRLSVAHSFLLLMALASLNLYSPLSMAVCEGMMLWDDFQVAGG